MRDFVSNWLQTVVFKELANFGIFNFNGFSRRCKLSRVFRKLSIIDSSYKEEVFVKYRSETGPQFYLDVWLFSKLQSE